MAIERGGAEPNPPASGALRAVDRKFSPTPALAVSAFF